MAPRSYLEFELINLKNHLNHSRKNNFNIEIKDEALIEELDKLEFGSEKSLKNYKFDESLALKVANTISSLVGSILPQNGTILQYANFLQKKSFFQQCIIDNADDLISQINYLKSQNEDSLFRGVSESKYMMYSSFQRFWNCNKCFESGKSYHEVVMDIVAKSRNDTTLKKYFDSFHDNLSDISILSLIQHYGQNSPLIDWSYNIDVALYFAINSSTEIQNPKSGIDNYLSLYYIPEKHLRAFNYKADVESILEPQFPEFMRQDGLDEEKFRSIDEKHKIKDYIKRKTYNIALNEFGKLDNLFKFPSVCFFSDKDVLQNANHHLVNNFNIINQKGGFLWNLHSNAPIEFVIKKFHRQHIDQNLPCNIVGFELNKQLIPIIQEYLDKNGIDDDYIYPKPKKIIDGIINNALK